MLSGVLEISLLLERFRNIDLFQQGLYFLRISLSNGRGNFAQVYDCVKQQGVDPLTSLLPVEYDSLEPYFSTSTFLIRFSEEETDIKEQWSLRFEGASSDMDTLVLSADLCYSELDRDFKDLATLPKRMDAYERIRFKPVSHSQLRLRTPRAGLLEPLVLEFDELHKAQVLGCVFCVLCDYHFRSQNSVKKNGSMVHHIADSLIVDKQGLPKLMAGADETERIYAEYVYPQARSHELLRQFMSDVVARYLPQQSKLLFSASPQPLELPHYRASEQPRAASFTEAVASHEALKICEALLTDISYVAEEIHSLFVTLKKLLSAFPLHCMAPLFEKRIERLRNWGNCYIRRERHLVSVVPALEEASQDSHRTLAAEMRKVCTALPSLYESGVEEQLMLTDSPILFEDSYYRRSQGTNATTEKTVAHRRKHLFVLVHGLHGKSVDMRLVKHCISSHSTLATILSSSSNEDNTERDIFEMGLRLAQEVKSHVAQWLPGRTMGRVSFVGYSLGGLIIRAALPHLTELSSLMYSFVTFSTPHLGHLADRSIAGAGLWVMERMSSKRLLKQLRLADSPNEADLALNRLSHAVGPEWFRYVVLCSSHQDKYVPHASARAELSEDIYAEAPLLADMASSLLQRIQPERFLRVDVDFPNSGISVDSVTGRSAHLQFISSEVFLRLFTHQLPAVFT